ncbi:MAG TPA: DUF885 domain-containing protein [Vicinamibacterales bacterium]|nr:DUF885 domain-containing protein [Vicinamibacterales bacterium]
MLRIHFAIACVCVLAAACSSPPPAGPPPGDAAATGVTSLADAYVKDYFEAFPHYALANGAPEVHPDRLGDHSLPALKRWQDREDQLLVELKRIDLKSVEGRPEAVTYKFLQNLLETAQGYRVCRIELWNVSPTWTGWQAEIPVIAGMQATASADNQRDAVARFTQLPKYVDDEIANLREGLRLKYTAPKHNVRTVIGQMDALLKAPLAESPFVQMAKADMPEFRKQLEALEKTQIRPAIQRYRDFLRDEYVAGAREEIGVSANPNGAACYEASVKYYATVAMTPKAVHDLGLAQMEKIQTEMRQIGERFFKTSDPIALLKLVRSDPKYRFKSRDELIKYAEAAVERAKQALPKVFGRIPSAPVIVEPYPPYLEKTAPGGQAVPPSADGKPGKYLINAYKANEQSRAGLESTAFHEAYPGHHMQAAIALERKELHPISRYFFLSGFGEGWALYTERLADEMGLFSSNVDKLGLLSNEALRAARLVVDSGMHVLGWTRKQAIDYVLSHTTETPDRAAAEIDRYIAVPAQATAYMIGNLEIRKLRSEAEQTLGGKFDIREFHDLVLADGSLPLWVLREKVERWIKSKSTS